jgi:hypothetical protein
VIAAVLAASCGRRRRTSIMEANLGSSRYELLHSEV